MEAWEVTVNQRVAGLAGTAGRPVYLVPAATALSGARASAMAEPAGTVAMEAFWWDPAGTAVAAAPAPPTGVRAVMEAMRASPSGLAGRALQAVPGALLRQAQAATEAVEVNPG